MAKALLFVMPNSNNEDSNGAEAQRFWSADQLVKIRTDAPAFHTRDGRVNTQGIWTWYGGPSNKKAYNILKRALAAMNSRGLHALHSFHGISQNQAKHAFVAHIKVELPQEAGYLVPAVKEAFEDHPPRTFNPFVSKNRENLWAQIWPKLNLRQQQVMVRGYGYPDLGRLPTAQQGHRD